MPLGTLQRNWRDLVDRRLPQAARARPDWPVRLDHCFARILLDNACGGPWRESVAPPAWANMPPERLAFAIDLGEAVLAAKADLAFLNRRSLAWRGKVRRAVPISTPASLTGQGFVLRRWLRADDAPFAELNADPEVMRHFPSTKNRGESLIEARAIDRRFESDGFGPWAVEVPGEGFVGFVGAMRLIRPMPFAGGETAGSTVEIGWRLARSAWGRGLATKAARLALADLYARCGVPAVVAFTAASNIPSRKVMERLGMAFSEEFLHPALPADHRLQPHVLYRLAADGSFAEAGQAPEDHRS
ncbi:GNAT family N-acetyltransferase [Methylobacterium sp. 10]|uniref:GNAT family N-acetyltransferase n=1 Tax=Methylobacterium sp. 10 TaxID=1101191 RepID=UPI00048093A3|nr:GNAT family N-acetyltransferase [Methylobacterium sp. 10]